MVRARFVLVVVLLAGCASAQLTAFRDPAYANTEYDRVAVFALGMTLQSTVRVEQSLCEKLSAARCVAGTSVLPPTRVYSTAEITTALAKAGADAVLLVSLASDNSQTWYAGSVMSGSTSQTTRASGSVNLYGNAATWSGTAQTATSTQAMATPVYQSRRQATAEIGLFDRRTGNIAWRGELLVSGKGALATRDAAFIGAATDKIASGLIHDGLIH